MKKIIVLLIVSLLLAAAVTMTVSAAKVNTSGTVNVTWNQGYVVMSMHNPYYTEGYTASANYATTDVFTVEKAGTKITWEDSDDSMVNHTVAVVSSWKKDKNSGENFSWHIG